METIDLCLISYDEFSAYFKSLKKVERIAFIRKNRSDVVKLTNADILFDLCKETFFSALLPLVKTGDKRADEQIKHFYATSNSHAVKARPTKEEEVEILKYAATRLDIVRFLREETTRFVLPVSGRASLGHIIYAHAPREVIDYLFGYICRNHFPVTERVAFYLFSKASADIIHSYLIKVGCFSGGMKHVSFTNLKALAERNDIADDEKFELLLLSVNRLPVQTQTIHDLRKAGLLDF